jgi:peptidoglycan/LPS O-acetylase OafA/YrhL
MHSGLRKQGKWGAMTIEQAQVGGHRANNFDFIRLLAAFLVVWGHSLILLKLSVPGVWGMSISTAGVTIFFALSGYLVTESWLRAPQISTFFLKRSLRIFPALAGCVLLCVFILGPILTRLSLSEYLQHPFALGYLTNIALYIKYSLPAVFDKNVYPHTVNGSLWSLPVEFFCYITVAALGQLRGRAHILFIIIAGFFFAGVSIYLTIAYKGTQIVWYATDVSAATSVIPYFFVGALLRLLKGRVPLRLDVALVLCFVLSVIEAQVGQLVLAAAVWLFVPYITLSFGLSATPILSSAGRFGDLSYGIYLYSFPVQQTLVYIFQNKLSGGQLIGYSAILSAVIAFVSWHVIEKNALRLKPKGKRDLFSAADRADASAHAAASHTHRLTGIPERTFS